MVERLAIDEDGGGIDLGAGVAGGFAGDRHATVLHPVAGFAAGAVAKVGEELVETAHVRRDGCKTPGEAQRESCSGWGASGVS